MTREPIYIYLNFVWIIRFFPPGGQNHICLESNFTGMQSVCRLHGHPVGTHMMGHTHGTHVWDCATLSPVWIVVVHCTLYIFTNFAMTGHDKVNDAYKMPQPTETSRPELIGCLSLKHQHIHWWQTLLLPCSEIQPKVKRP